MKKDQPQPGEENSSYHGYGAPPGHDQSGYHYGYQQGYGYGYGDHGAPTTRSLRDYFLILRERIWVLVTVALSVFLLALIYTFKATPQYQSNASIVVLRQEDRRVQFENVVQTQIQNDVDFQTQIKILEGPQIINNVARRLRDEDLQRLRAPYQNPVFEFLEPKTTEEILATNRRVVPIRSTLVVNVLYTHPSAEIAALVANLFAEEYINYNMFLRRVGAQRASEDLRIRADRQREDVEKLELDLARFKEQHRSVSFDAASDIDGQTLVRLNEILTADKRIYDEAQIRWNQVERSQADGRPLWELSYIAAVPQVNELLTRMSAFRINEAQLSQRYRDKHPRMIELRDAVRQTREELDRAVNSTAETIRSDFLRARENFQNSERRLAQKQDEIIEFQKLRVAYNSLIRSLTVNQEMYQYLYSRYQQTLAQASNDAETARVIGSAVPAAKPHLPRHSVNLAIGLFGGLGLGAALVILLAFFDDKIKSAFDIETVVELPLLGLIPRLKKREATEKARIVQDGHEKQTLEAFRSIHSTLKLGDESRAKAKVILTTSTIPSEGKSFVCTNLAFTYASHGEKVCIVDCDLRMPNVAKSLELENKRGVLSYVEKGLPLDACLIREVAPNLDVLPTGGRARSPTQVLGSPAFAALLGELRERYDRVFIDSPPLAPVSDALTLLPNVDGVIYVIRFNKVKRKTARTQVRRIFEGKTPVFGAVLNNIAASVASYYYSHYYDQSYAEYYLAEDEAEAEARGDKPRRRRKSGKSAEAIEPEPEALATKE